MEGWLRKPERRSICFHHLLFCVLLSFLQQPRGLFAGAEQLKVQRFIIRRGRHPLSVS